MALTHVAADTDAETIHEILARDGALVVDDLAPPGVIDAIAEYPLLGAGSAASSWALPSTSQQHVQPHNVVLQFLLSWGIFGTAAALFLIARATHKAYIIARSAPLAIPFMAMVCCLLVNALFDGAFYFARHVMLMMIGFGVIFAIGRLPGSWKG